MAVTNNVKSHEQNLFTIPPTYLHCIAYCLGLQKLYQAAQTVQKLWLWIWTKYAFWHTCQFAYLSICIFNFANCAGIFGITETLKTTNYIFFEFCQCARNVKDTHFTSRHFCEFTLGALHMPIVKTQKCVTMTKCIFRGHFAWLLKCVIWQLSATLHIW